MKRQRRTWEDNIKMNVKDDERIWTGLIWLRIGTSVGFLPFGGAELWKILTLWSRVLENLSSSSATQEITRILKKPEGSLPHSQYPAIHPYPEPDQSNPCPIPILQDPF